MKQKLFRSMIKSRLRAVKKMAQSFSASALVPVAWGAVEPIQSDKIDEVSELSNKIANVATGLATVLFALAAIFIIISGIFYLTAAGNQTQLDKAKNTLIYAIVGVVLGLIAFGVAGLVKNFLVGPT